MNLSTAIVVDVQVGSFSVLLELLIKPCRSCKIRNCLMMQSGRERLPWGCTLFPEANLVINFGTAMEFGRLEQAEIT